MRCIAILSSLKVKNSQHPLLAIRDFTDLRPAQVRELLEQRDQREYMQS